MARYSLNITVWESAEPIIRDSNENFEERVQELYNAGKLLIHNRTVVVTLNFNPGERLPPDVNDKINDFLTTFRNKATYPFLKGRIIPTLV